MFSVLFLSLLTAVCGEEDYDEYFMLPLATSGTTKSSTPTTPNTTTASTTTTTNIPWPLDPMTIRPFHSDTKLLVEWCRGLRSRVPPSPEVVALAAYPGSGRKWLRYLLQQVTGIITGSDDYNEMLRKHGFPGEGVTNGSVLVVKTSRPPSNIFATSAILLIRNPRDAILSEFNTNQAGFFGHAPITKFSLKYEGYKNPTEEWSHPFVSEQIRKWQSFYNDWLYNFRGRVHVVFYEALLRYAKAEIKYILDFLRMYKPKPKYLQCMLERRQGMFRRVPRVEPFDPFSDTMNKQLNAARVNLLKKVSSEGLLFPTASPVPVL